MTEEKTLADIPARDAAMIEAIAKGVSYIRVALREMTGVDEPLNYIAISPEVYSHLSCYGGTPEKAGEVQFIGVPFYPVTEGETN